MLNIPTAITISRILLVPVFIYFVTVLKNSFSGALVFAVASATDFLDGYLARRSQQVTKFGVLLDPIADKILVISALIVLVDQELIKAWIAIVIIIREFLVTGLRLVAVSREIYISAETGGKLKTGMQIAAILLLFIGHSTVLGWTSAGLSFAGVICLWISMIIGIFSGIKYFIYFYKRI
ncbi:MAG TPA: CDP-diacylglycerol--glycerol-3-phosphate 3-phosphatidyltransferase [Thermodesulfovibrionia bacterium]|nr:CDP-diacylglycerol--glycerol-3-phosphate 3-phosphatidyltransferase [Thermodesulfovibrionia bacterium]